MRAKQVVFDLGGVLVDWDPRHLYRTLFDDEAEMETFLAEVWTMEWNETLDAGRPFSEGVAELVERHPDHTNLLRAFHERWEETLGGAHDATVEVVAELRGRGVPLYALSNWSAETFPFARERFEFLTWFDGLVISGEVGTAKPDHRIFAELLDRFDLRAEATLFVDDSPRNVEAALALGLNGHVFTTPDELRAVLSGHGLIGGRPQGGGPRGKPLDGRG